MKKIWMLYYFNGEIGLNFWAESEEAMIEDETKGPFGDDIIKYESIEVEDANHRRSQQSAEIIVAWPF